MNKTDSFALLLLFLIIAGTMFTYYLTRDQYTHPELAVQCDEPYAYPICELTVQPDVQAEPAPEHMYLGSIFMTVLAFILVILSYKASVTRQENFNVTGKAAPVRQASRGSAESRTPDAIPDNTVQEDEVVRNG